MHFTYEAHDRSTAEEIQIEPETDGKLQSRGRIRPKLVFLNLCIYLLYLYRAQGHTT